MAPAVKKKRTSAQQARYRRQPHNRFSQIKAYCKQKGREFALDKDEFVSLIALPCFYCGGPLNTTGCGLDRIDNTKGYIRGNVLPACWECNNLRGNTLSVAETQAMVLFLKELRAIDDSSARPHHIYYKCKAAALALLAKLEGNPA